MDQSVKNKLWRFRLAQAVGQSVGQLSRRLHLGNGSVMPGHISLLIEPNTLRQARQLMKRGCIFVTGTNGKSTTTYYLFQILSSLGYRVCTNHFGANLQTGLAAACLNLKEEIDYGIFEVDEGTVWQVADQLQPSQVVGLNFSRDQLDRYTEIDSLLKKVLAGLETSRALYLYNAKNPYAATLGNQYQPAIGYYVENQGSQPLLDWTVCPACQGQPLQSTDSYRAPFLCPACGFCSQSAALVSNYDSGLLRIFGWAIGCPSPELAETMTAVALCCQELGIPVEAIIHGLERTEPQPAHQRLIALGRATIRLILVKNPESFNREIHNLKAAAADQWIIAVNRRIADGLDSSWLWDVAFESLPMPKQPIIVAGQAADDLRLRLKVAGRPSVDIGWPDQLLSYLSQQPQSFNIYANYTAYRELERAIRTVVPKGATLKPAFAQQLEIPQ